MKNILPEETISINGSHDCSCTFIDKDNHLRIYEYERFIKIRYAMFSKRLENYVSDGIKLGTTDLDRHQFLDHIKKNLINENIRLILHHDLFSDNDISLLKEFFPDAEFKYCNHHESHAYGAYHLSKFNKCLIFSVDGGGRDNGVVTTTNVYTCDHDDLKKIDCPGIDVGNPYNSSARLLADISGLGPAGKLMGLTAYGNVRMEWVDVFKQFYRTNNVGYLREKINIGQKLSGQIAWDVARTSQFVFEELLFQIVRDYVEKYNLNVILTGGCALNVLFNQRIHEYLQPKNLELYIPPNPNDCGLAHGMFVNEHKNYSKDEICFSGVEILDENTIDDFNHPSEPFDMNVIVEYLRQGKILAVIDGYSEVGPRALGNRSIICYPIFPNMKDILNSKVKFRQWFRPFAPVCKYEDKNKFFENAPDCKYMSFAPAVKKEWQSKLPSITHIDGTSRLQTVHPNNFFYDLLDKMDKNGLVPVILNTSFNIKGRPILTTLHDAFHVLDVTELDYLLHGNKIYSKKQ